MVCAYMIAHMDISEQFDAPQLESQSIQDLLKLKERDETAFVIAAAAYLDIAPFLVPAGFVPGEDLLAGKKSEFWLKAKAVPLMRVGSGTTVAFADPFDLPVREEISRALGGALWCVVAPEQGIVDAIGRVKAREDAANPTLAMENIMKGQDAEIEFSVAETKDEAIEATVETADEAPVIRMVNSMMLEALKTKASDIHFEAGERASRLRYRIDGELVERPAPPKALHSAVVSRIKIMSNLDIAERRQGKGGRGPEGQSLDPLPQALRRAEGVIGVLFSHWQERRSQECKKSVV